LVITWIAETASDMGVNNLTAIWSTSGTNYAAVRGYNKKPRCGGKYVSVRIKKPLRRAVFCKP